MSCDKTTNVSKVMLRYVPNGRWVDFIGYAHQNYNRIAYSNVQKLVLNCTHFFDTERRRAVMADRVTWTALVSMAVIGFICERRVSRQEFDVIIAATQKSHLPCESLFFTAVIAGTKRRITCDTTGFSKRCRLVMMENGSKRLQWKSAQINLKPERDEKCAGIINRSGKRLLEDENVTERPQKPLRTRVKLRIFWWRRRTSSQQSRIKVKTVIKQRMGNETCEEDKIPVN